MRTMLSIWLLIAVMAVGADSEATLCSSDQVPAATLLFPSVVFDYSDPTGGRNTILGITNTGAKAQIVHVRFWSDTGIPVLGFNVVLSGYDVQTIDMRAILSDGVLPITGTSGAQVVTGSVSKAGPVDGSPDLPQPAGTNVLAQRCNPTWPGYPNYISIPPGLLAQIQTLLQLSQALDRSHNDCLSPGTYQVGDEFESRSVSDPTWMYVTADVVWTCTRLLPDDAAYWQRGPSGNPGFDPAGAQLMHDNVLMGDVMWYDLVNRFGEAGRAVHIEAGTGLGDTAVASPVRNPGSGQPQSFYHHYSSPHGALDGREPLPTGWAFPYMHLPPTMSTKIRVWKAPSPTSDLDFDFTITDLPFAPWVQPTVDFGAEMQARDCLAYTYYSWDDDENVTTGGIEPNHLPLVTQEISADQFSLVDVTGWMLFLWPSSNTADSTLYQTWMGVEAGAFDQYSMAMPATAVWNNNCVGQGR